MARGPVARPVADSGGPTVVEPCLHVQLGHEVVALVARRRPEERREDDLVAARHADLDGRWDDAERAPLGDARDGRDGHDLARLVAEDVGVEAQRALQHVEPAVQQDRALVGAAEVLEHVLVRLDGKQHLHNLVLRVLLRAPGRRGARGAAAPRRRRLPRGGPRRHFSCRRCAGTEFSGKKYSIMLCNTTPLQSSRVLLDTPNLAGLAAVTLQNDQGFAIYSSYSLENESEGPPLLQPCFCLHERKKRNLYFFSKIHGFWIFLT